jgi:hypothetical protein
MTSEEPFHQRTLTYRPLTEIITERKTTGHELFAVEKHFVQRKLAQKCYDIFPEAKPLRRKYHKFSLYGVRACDVGQLANATQRWQR